MAQVPKKARAVIIGGGVSGCSVAYHLAALGWRDVVLLERRRLTCGTTWHAAGLVGQLRASQNLTRLAKYSAELYTKLEKETGVATGMRQNGSITVALTHERHEEILRQASLARAFDVAVEAIGPAQVKDMYPHVRTDDVIGAVYLPGDGQCDPANIALALSAGARQNGVRIIEGATVTAVHQKGGRVSGLAWRAEEEAGQIETDIVINCAGMWARELGALSGVNIALHACEHFYIITEPVDGLRGLPVLRVPDECAYYKEDAGKMMLGAFEPVAKPWGMEGIPEDFCFDQLPEDFDHFEPILTMGINRMPLLENAGINTFFNGPESFTPDDRYYLGEAPDLRGYWVAAGYNSIGIVSSGGAGFALAQWINDDAPPFDLWEVDIRRTMAFQANRHYLRTRVSETLGLLYADHFPHRQPQTARGIRRSGLHEHLKRAGACFGETAGWERAEWFAKKGEKARDETGWKRQNWFARRTAEHNAVREGVGLFDMSSFGKIRVEGADARAVLQRICGADIAVDEGRIVYTQFLNSRGGIEADVTITRLNETAYLVVTSAACLIRDLTWIRRHIPDGACCVAVDVTAAETVISIMGPKARALLQPLTPQSLDNDAFPFASAQVIEIGMGLARAHRISYVGELGWELYVSAEMAVHVYETIVEAGAAHDLVHCGLRALDSLRMEKAFRHFGHDISDEDHVLEAGLGFAVAVDKPASPLGDFIGREAVLQKRKAGVDRMLLQFQLNDPEPLLYHNEPIWRDGEMVGYLTSGSYGHHLGAAIGLGYVPRRAREPMEQMERARYEIEIAGTRVGARASRRPLYDPRAQKVKA